jgi:hypothetical protein
MSDCPGVRCDRCGAVAAQLGDGPFAEWSIVRQTRSKPFRDTGHLDLCPRCTEDVYAFIRARTTKEP